MELKFNYKTVKIKKVSDSIINEKSGGTISKGMFLPEATFDDPNPDVVKFLTLTFEPVILISNSLNTKESQEVLKHEKVHAKDCKDLADKLAEELEAVLKEKRDPEIELRMKWFHYDRCEKAREFHAKDKGFDVELCNRPLDTRPSKPRPKK